MPAGGRVLGYDGHSPAALIAVAVGLAAVAAGYAWAARRWVAVAGDDIPGQAPTPAAAAVKASVP